MSQLIKSNWHYLALVANTSRQQRKSLIHTATKAQIKALTEICVNLLKGNIHLSRATKATLLPHKNVYRNLASKGLSGKKKVLCIRGKEIELLLSACLPYIEEYGEIDA